MTDELTTPPPADPTASALEPAASDAGQPHDQGSSGGRHLAQDPSNDVDDYTFVRLPNGSVVPVLKADIHDVPETATQTVPAAALVPVEDPHFYVWLANGEVIRVKQSDLPPAAGANAHYGYWRIGDKLYSIVNVVPVEQTVKDA